MPHGGLAYVMILYKTSNDCCYRQFISSSSLTITVCVCMRVCVREYLHVALANLIPPTLSVIARGAALWH